MKGKLFDTKASKLNWAEFDAKGFKNKVGGVISGLDSPPCCGVPVGGLGTGCIDIDAAGVYGFSSIFNPSRAFPDGRRMPRKLPDFEPFLGIAVDGTAWVMASEKMLEGGDIPVCTCTDPLVATITHKSAVSETVKRPKIQNVQPANEIHYWGHYPIVDMEYETEAPLSVGMRAWAPFVPGSAVLSNIPAALFEVHIRNTSAELKHGTVAFSFPGPDSKEAMTSEIQRRNINDCINGVMVSSARGVNYTLGVLNEENVRTGASLGKWSPAWSRMAEELPLPEGLEYNGIKVYRDAGASVAVDFNLEAGQEKVLNFVLAWYAPIWEGATRPGDSGNELKVNQYTHMYAARYNSSLDVARRMAAEHDDILKRILAWQNVIYSEETLPLWLRDSLINNLCLIAEDSYWAQAKPPLGDWCFPGGLFALNESPRDCPHVECIPCDWYGNQPVVYFFPELALSTLRGFMHLQREDGNIPFELGQIFDLPDMVTPSYEWQVSLNGTCYINLVDRLWQRTGESSILKEFYESVKKCNTFVMNLRTGPGAPISMPDGNVGMEWFEYGEWLGMCAHIGGLRLTQLRIMERMAEHMGDTEYAERCRQWFAEGSRAMEEELWTGEYYLNYYEKETGRKSDVVMGYQLDGEWDANFHGLPGVFDQERIKIVLDKIRKLNVSLTQVGAANFVNPDGSPLSGESKVATYGKYSMFVPEVIVLAMTYMKAGEYSFGLKMAEGLWENLVIKQRHPWDLPNTIHGDSGKRSFGTDYYQGMMLWSLPAGIEGKAIKDFCADGGLVDRVIKAGC